MALLWRFFSSSFFCLHLHVSILPTSCLCLIRSPTHAGSHSEHKKKKEDEDEEGLSLFTFHSRLCFSPPSPVMESGSQRIVFLRLRRAFLWLNATLDRLGAWWKPHVPALDWIWSELRYRLILPCALITSTLLWGYDCSSMSSIAGRNFFLVFF